MVGLSATVFKWFVPYLTEESFLENLDTCSPGTHGYSYPVINFSPILFNLYILGDVISWCWQMYIAVSPDDTGLIDLGSK